MNWFRHRRQDRSIEDVIEIVDDLIVRHERAKAQADLSLRMMSKALDEMERTFQLKVRQSDKGGAANV